MPKFSYKIKLHFDHLQVYAQFYHESYFYKFSLESYVFLYCLVIQLFDTLDQNPHLNRQ